MAFDIWTAETPQGLVRWTDSEPYVSGPSIAAITVIERFDELSEPIVVAVCGPYLEPVLSDPFAVAAFINMNWDNVKFSNNAPDPGALIPPTPDGAVN